MIKLKYEYLQFIKKNYFLYFLLLNLFIFASCERKNDDEIKIGLSMGSLVLDRWAKDRDILKKTIEEENGKLFIKYAHDNPTLQSEQIKKLVDEGVDVIIVIPDDKDSLVKALKYARRKKVKIISYDRMVTNSPIDLYVSFNTIKVGELIGQSILKKEKKGKFVIINGPKSDENSFGYNKGIKNALKPYMGKNKIQVVSEIWAKDWRETSSYAEVNKLISKGIDFDAIIAGNDILAEGAITALIENNKLVPVVGQDADLAACQRIVENTQYATVYKDFFSLASFVGKISVKMANNKQIYSNEILNNGKYDIPTYFLNKEIKIITKENINSVIIDRNIYKYSDIYLKR